MPTIQVPEAVKAIIDRHVAEGCAASESDFVEAAVRRYAEDLEYDEDEIIAAAEAGLADIRAGNYTTIDGPEAHKAFWDQIARDVREKVAEMRADAKQATRRKA